MAFPTIPTVGAGRVLVATQTGTSQTRTFPSLSGLTKASGDVLIAICLAYQSSASAGTVFSGWGASFTEFLDVGGASNGAIGAAWKVSDGTETGTFTVTQAATVTGDCAFVLMAIPNGNNSTAPAGGTIVNNTSAAADIASLNPSGWGTLDTLWIAVALAQETSTTSTFTGVGAAPTNYGNYVDTGISQDAIGGVEGAVAFRQLNAASDDPGGFATIDTTNARNSSVLIAVMPAPQRVTLTRATEIDTSRPLIHNHTIYRTLGVAATVTSVNAIITGHAYRVVEVDTAQPLDYEVIPGGTHYDIFPALETDSAQPAETRELGVSSETDTARPLTFARGYTLDPAAETDLANTIFPLATLPALEIDSAQPVTFDLVFPGYDLSPALETDSAQTLDVDKDILKTVGVAAETDSVRPLAYSQASDYDITTALEADTARPVTFTKTIRKTLGVASETDSAQAISYSQAGTYLITPALEADSARPLVVTSAYGISPALETDLANTIIPLAVLAAVETDSARPLTITTGVKQIQPVLETDSAQPVTYEQATNYSITPATETDTVGSILANASVDPATETDTARPLSVTGGGADYNIAPAAETDTARTLDVDKHATADPAAETDTARPLSFAKTIYKTITRATETDTAQARSYSQAGSYTIGPAGETDTARPVSYTHDIAGNILPALEADTARPLSVTKPIVKTIGFAAETSSAQALDISSLRTLDHAAELDTATALVAVKTIYKTIGHASETDEARFVAFGGIFPIGHASETDTALSLSYGILPPQGLILGTRTGHVTQPRTGRISRPREGVFV